MKPTEMPFVQFTHDGRWAIGTVLDGVQREVMIYVAALDPAEPAAPLRWKKLVDYADEVAQFDYFDDQLVLISTKGAPRGRLLRARLDAGLATSQDAAAAQRARHHRRGRRGRWLVRGGARRQRQAPAEDGQRRRARRGRGDPPAGGRCLRPWPMMKAPGGPPTRACPAPCSTWAAGPGPGRSTPWRPTAASATPACNRKARLTPPRTSPPPRPW